MVFVTDVTENGKICWQPSIVYARETATTCEQVQTEKECSLYFDLLGTHQQSTYFIEKGLFIARNEEQNSDNRKQGDNDEVTDSVPMEPQYQVGLLRDAHAQYLYTVFHEQQRLRPSFTSLDSSHTWMIYWCLHGLDLLGQWPTPSDEHPLLSQRILSTLQSCWTTSNVSLPKHVVESDPILSLYEKDSLDGRAKNNGDIVEFANAGGFGGGPDQLPHAATTYAAVMSLCILASSSNQSDPENAALQYLLSIRAPVYVWFCTLYNESNGSFRMHIDGEIDVRATYCVLAVIHILQMIPLSSSCFFTQPRIADYLSSCQSVWEGGFGGEQGAEAHGGYTFCAVASLQLFHVQSPSSFWLLDSMESCAAWLAQRQMSYEGGFSGRINKLVDGCYSFWQGSAAIIVQEQLRQIGSQNKEKDANMNIQVVDPWCAKGPSSSDRYASLSNPAVCLFDADMLERYILLCSQDENGGLRDKPSKGRDFYHSCYCLSGLSIAQHFGHEKTILNNMQSDVFSNEYTSVHQTHPCYNIRVEHVEFICANFRNYSP
jgi:protein farnesyltransferase subunit beta